MASKTPRGLGKGVSAILGENTGFENFRQPVGYVNKSIVGQNTGKQDFADILRIPIDEIEPNPFQPRITFDQEALEGLADSIKALGLIQPITVRKIADGKYQIISGERRFRACRLAGLDMVPAYIRDASEQGMLEMAIVENIQRENLDPIEVAMSYQRLIEECNLTQEQMALRVGKKRASVTNYLRLLKLPAKLQHDLKVGTLSVGHAKVLLGVEDENIQEQLCDMVISNDLSVRQLEDKVRKLGERKKKSSEDNSDQDLPEEYYKVLEYFGKIFGDNISLRRSNSGKGSLTLRFNSDEEMSRLLELLKK